MLACFLERGRPNAHGEEEEKGGGSWPQGQRWAVGARRGEEWLGMQEGGRKRPEPPPVSERIILSSEGTNRVSVRPLPQALLLALEDDDAISTSPLSMFAFLSLSFPRHNCQEGEIKNRFRLRIVVVLELTLEHGSAKEMRRSGV